MPIGRIARGTGVVNGDGGAAGDLTITGVVVGATGSTLVVLVATDNAVFVPGTPTWGGTPLTLAVQRLGGSTRPYVGVFYLPNATAGTASVFVPSGLGDPSTIAAVCIEVTVGELAPLDQIAAADGSGTNPSSGAAPTTTQPNELLIGAVATQGPSGDVAGTWGGSFTNGQRVGSTGGSVVFKATISEGYRIVAATDAYSAAKTGITSRPWEAAIATFKELLAVLPKHVVTLSGVTDKVAALSGVVETVVTLSGVTDKVAAKGLVSL